MNWKDITQPIESSAFYKELMQKVEQEYAQHKCFPPKNEIFRAFELTPFNEVSVVILGQDPYHDHFQANGLSFSVSNKVKTPPSLKNIFKELENDLGIIRTSNELDDWAKQGVLLLNTVLTVRAHQANSHKDLGWETYTDFIISELAQKRDNLIFVLWGKSAAKKKKLIPANKHYIIEEAHPSPLSAYRGFFGSKPFSKINEQLIKLNKKPIEWK